MPSCVLLSDETVFGLLTSLSRQETIEFRNSIARSLISLAVEGERQYQPPASVITRPDGRKILFRPFTSPEGPGVKIIVDSISNPVVINNASSQPSEGQSQPALGLHGMMTLCDSDGVPRGLINADEITAYRTAMSVMIPLMWRDDVSEIVMFGAGNAARWHLDIALRLKGADIKHITIINRTVKKADNLVERLREWHAQFPSVDTLSPQQEDYEEKAKTALRRASVVCCAIPSYQPLFPAAWLELEEPPRPCFISGVGSWQSDMIEIPPELISRASEAGAVLTDDVEEAMKSSGEFIQTKLHKDQVTELGMLLDKEDPSCVPLSSNLSNTLSAGLVVYKSIGVSLTDLAASNALLKLAKAKGKGQVVFNF